MFHIKFFGLHLMTDKLLDEYTDMITSDAVESMLNAVKKVHGGDSNSQIIDEFINDQKKKNLDYARELDAR